MIRLLLLTAALLGACAHVPDQPGAGKPLDVRAAKFIAPQELFSRAAGARHVILGEIHDNPEHHRLQRAVLEALPGPRALAMEQFDGEHQAAIDEAISKGADAEGVADAGHFDRKGWNWPLYRPLVQFALEHRWPIIAANLSRGEARRIVADPAASHLPTAPVQVQAALERDIIDGHCGQRPEDKRLAGMVEAQRARDARMAASLKGSAVLIAGAGHARRDRGVPLYLASADVISIAFQEVGDATPDYRGQFDYVWFTTAAPRKDPCAG